MQETNEKLPIHISVIIPSYNSEPTILETICSVQQQTYGKWEIIVVDDGSTDGTLSLISSLVEKDNRISIITQSNQGVCAARNIGIQNAQYDWLLFLDSDDWIAAHYLERMTDVIVSSSEIDGVHCGWTRVTPDGKILREMYGPSFTDLFPVLAMQCPFSIHACVIRKSLVAEAGGFDTTLKTCEDWDLWQKIARIGARFELVNEVMAYYRMRKNSLSSDGIQFFNDALRVLSRGHLRDDRLSHLTLKHPEGELLELLPGRKLGIATWLAGYLIGSGHDATHLLNNLATDPDPSLNSFWIADNIFDAAIISNCLAISDWHLLYPGIETNLSKFISALEVHCHAKGLAKRIKLHLEKLILQNTQFDWSFTLGSYYATCLEITEPIKDIRIESDLTDRLYCKLNMEGEYLGDIEVPVCDRHVSAYVLKDVIAAQFHWPVLGRFFQHHIYSKVDMETVSKNKLMEDRHDEIGWTTFMQQLWNRTSWKANKFYDAGLKESSAKRFNETEVKVIEISQELPDIIVRSNEKFNLVFSISGVNAGTVTIPVKNKLITASQIRAAININMGLELSRICVREALIGKPLTDSTPLLQRLNESALAANNFTTINSLILGRRTGEINTSVSRRAQLPATTAVQLSKMARAVHEPVIQHAENIRKTVSIFYTPELITSMPEKQWNFNIKNQEKGANVYGRQHFETLFSKQADPWKYTHPYEQTKYEFTLSLIPRKPINKALEIACAEGHFTEQLAPLVYDLIAADISQVALERAASRCKHFNNIRYQYLDLIEDDLPGQFDLITCSEVLYYVGDVSKLRVIAKKIANALLPEGYLVMAHAHQVIDEPNKPGFDWSLPYGAKTIGKTFAAIPDLQLVKEIQTPLYRVQLFQRKKRNLFSWLGINKPTIQYFDQPTPIPEAVIDSVRWNGGKPSSTTVISQVSTSKLPILMYHRIAPEGATKMSRYRITPVAFEQQLKYLKDSGYYSVSLYDWATAIAMQRPLPGLAIALTFDDAYQDFYEYAWPLLQKYGFSATVFLVSEQIGKQNTWDEAYGEKLPLMGWKEILELQKQGIQFGSHSASHSPLTSLTPTDIVLEGARSRKDLYHALQKPVDLFAYPYGYTDDIVTHLIGACGYTIGLTCENKLSIFKDNPMQLPRIEVEGSLRLEEFISKLS